MQRAAATWPAAPGLTDAEAAVVITEIRAQTNDAMTPMQSAALERLLKTSGQSIANANDVIRMKEQHSTAGLSATVTRRGNLVMRSSNSNVAIDSNGNLLQVSFRTARGMTVIRNGQTHFEPPHLIRPSAQDPIRASMLKADHNESMQLIDVASVQLGAVILLVILTVLANAKPNKARPIYGTVGWLKLIVGGMIFAILTGASNRTEASTFLAFATVPGLLLGFVFAILSRRIGPALTTVQKENGVTEVTPPG